MMQKRQDIAGEVPWLIAFLVWPIASFIASFRRVGSRMFSVILVLFYFLYGYTYVISGKDQDTYRTSQYFLETSRLTYHGFLQKMSSVYEVGSKPDIFQDILQFLVSRFTDDIQVYFASIAVVFAIFVARVFEVTFKGLQQDRKKMTAMIMICALFLLIIFVPSRINSFRHYLAAAIFISSMYAYATEGSVKNLIFLLATPLIHFGFLLVLPLVFLFLLIRKHVWICYAIVVLSFVFSAESVEFLRQNLSLLDENAYQYHANAYTSEVYLGQVTELKGQRYFVLDVYIYYTTLFFLGLLIYHSKFLKQSDAGSFNLYVFALLIFSFVNFFSALESVANRFGVMYHGFCCVFLIRLYLTTKIQLPKIVWMSFLGVFLVYATIVIRIYMQSASVSTAMLLFPVSIFSPVEVSILELFK